MEILFARSANATNATTGYTLTDSQARGAIEAGAPRLQVMVGDTAFRPFLGLPQAQQEMLARLLGASLGALADSVAERLQSEAQEAHILWRQAQEGLQAAAAAGLKAREDIEQAFEKLFPWEDQAHLGMVWSCAAHSVCEANARERFTFKAYQDACSARTEWRETREQMGYARH